MSGMATEMASCAKANTPGSTVLWKGLSLAHTVGLFNLDNTVLDFTTIISNPPSDFSIGGGYHWVLDKEIAIRYVKWAKNKSDVGECVILRLEIPNLKRKIKTAMSSSLEKSIRVSLVVPEDEVHKQNKSSGRSKAKRRGERLLKRHFARDLNLVVVGLVM